jgi:hypothetical protein
VGNAGIDAVRRAEAAERTPETLVMASDGALRLTREDAERFSEELVDLMNTWRRRGRTAGREARTYQLLQILRPAREVADASGDQQG